MISSTGLRVGVNSVLGVTLGETTAFGDPAGPGTDLGTASIARQNAGALIRETHKPPVPNGSGEGNGLLDYLGNVALGGTIGFGLSKIPSITWSPAPLQKDLSKTKIGNISSPFWQILASANSAIGLL